MNYVWHIPTSPHMTWKRSTTIPTSTPYTLHPTPCTKHPTTHTLHPTPYNLQRE